MKNEIKIVPLKCKLVSFGLKRYILHNNKGFTHDVNNILLKENHLSIERSTMYKTGRKADA